MLSIHIYGDLSFISRRIPKKSPTCTTRSSGSGVHCPKYNSETLSGVRGVWCARNLRQMALSWCHSGLGCIMGPTDLRVFVIDCRNSSNILAIYLLFLRHVLRSAVTDTTSKSILPSLMSTLSLNCPTTVPTTPVVADYNMKWSTVITWKYSSLPMEGYRTQLIGPVLTPRWSSWVVIYYLGLENNHHWEATQVC